MNYFLKYEWTIFQCPANNIKIRDDFFLFEDLIVALSLTGIVLLKLTTQVGSLGKVIQVFCIEHIFQLESTY